MRDLAAIRFLLRKDLQILRRSKLLVGLLVVYPIAIALLIGVALSRGPDKPKVAFLNQVPLGQTVTNVGGEDIDFAQYADRFFEAIDPIEVHSRSEAIDKVESGDALAALIIPPDIVDRLNGGLGQGEVEVVYNGDAVKQSFVQSTIDAELAKANAALSAKIRDVAVADLRVLTEGGEIHTPLGSENLLGLRTAKEILEATLRVVPEGSSIRPGLEQVDNFANQALIGLDFATPALNAVSKPIEVKSTVLSGSRTPLDAFAVALAVAVSLLFVAVLLASGVLALEREEQAYGRLVRGLVSRGALLAEKIVLAAACAALVSLLMLCGIGALTGVDWGRFGQWLVALAAGGLGCSALGVAIGALAREVRAASLLALLLALPLAFLALVPSGSVSSGLYAVVRVVNAAFPFKPSLQALDAAVNGADPGLVGPALHLLALTVAYGVLARVALRRFTA
ncbi:MAG TPA: ABC transporter permease [Capillimicrobium sp.]|nr:ABC transporter permease [Capillimicrobium sp.]